MLSKILTVSTVLLLLNSSTASAQLALCRAVIDDKKRLECYDRATGPAALGKAVSRSSTRTPNVTSEMQDYVGDLDQQFLKSGINMTILARAHGSKGITPSDVGYPSLFFLGYFDRALVYAIVTKLMPNSFNAARNKGFLTVEFFDKGDNGVYRFDLRKPAPACARDLCF